MVKKLILIICALMLASCSSSRHEKLQGYIEGRFNYLASNYAGIVIKLLEKRGNTVKAGQPLAVLDTEPQKAALDAANENLRQAQAQYTQIKANLTLAEVTLSRYIELGKRHAIPQQSIDTAKANRDATLAQLNAANANLLAMRANVSQAKWSYGQKLIIAPLNGKIFDNYYEVGDLVPANYPVFGLLAPENVYLAFFIPEPLLAQISVGEKVQFSCDHCKTNWSATIRFISPNTEYTPPVIYSHDSRQKLVYRVEAAIAPELTSKLHPGQPVDIDITLNN